MNDGGVRTARRAAAGAGALAAAAVLLGLSATVLVGQSQDGRALSLEEALRMAKRNNPDYLTRANDQAAADWGVRAAYGSLVPSASARGSFGYTEAGVQNFGTVDLGVQSTDWFSSSYRLGVDWRLDGETFFGVSSARASQEATQAGIRAAEFDLQTAVTLQYMTALRARDAVDVARDQFDRARQNLEIVETRVASGMTAATEGRQAEVDLGRAEVALLEAERLFRAEKLRLMEQMGVPMEGEVELVSSFEIFQPRWGREQLLDAALDEHPALRSARAQMSANRARARQARSSYFPTVSMGVNLAGFTNQALNEDFLLNNARSSIQGARASCMQLHEISRGLSTPLRDLPDCNSSRYTFDESDREAILARNSVFPFDFTKSPMNMSLTVSLPIFQGFSRQLQVEEAQAAARDADHARRAEELRLRTAVTQWLDNLELAHRQVEIETRNRELAEQRLVEARQRYQAGNTSILELMDAQTSLSTAERDYLDALYDFHHSLVALEAATGRSLRPAGTTSSRPGGEN
jgi:outer membrane protein